MDCRKTVTIIVPCYNHAKYIGDAIQGLLSQDYQFIELIIGDDCSTDKSVDIVKKYENQLKQKMLSFKLVINEKNIGLANNLNNLVLKATGEYIKIIASDDILEEHCISEFVKYMEEHANISVCISNSFLLSEKSDYNKKNIIGLYYDEQGIDVQHDLVERLYIRNFICAPSVFINKNVFTQYGLYDTNSKIEDWEFWLRLATGGAKFAYINKPLVYYRQNESSLSHISVRISCAKKTFENLYQNEMYIIEKYKSFIMEDVYLNRVKTSYHNYYLYAIDLNLFSLAQEIHKNFKQYGIRLTIAEKVKVLLIRLRIYYILAGIKHGLEKDE